MFTKVLGKYKITYDRGIVNEKYLISQESFNNIYKPTKEKIVSLELLLNDSKDKEVRKKIKDELRELSNSLYQMFSDSFFTDESPLCGAIISNKLILPDCQGGEQYCKVELI